MHLKFPLKFVLPLVILLFFNSVSGYAQLKSIVYDFDGLDIGATDLPEGDYYSGDIISSISDNPLGENDMLGDRCIKLQANWNGGTGSFGRGISRYVEFDRGQDVLNFYFYNPSSNNQNANFEVIIGDDDDGDKIFNGGIDDVWKKSFSIPAGGGWQLYPVPLSQLSDGNTQGNGNFDIAFTNNQGCLLFVEFKFTKAPTAGNATFFLDMIAFSEGSLPHGKSEFDLPYGDPNGYCHLGVFTNEGLGLYHLSPSKFEALFPAGKKITYVNTFLQWAYGSTTPSEMPGSSAQILLNNGYTPVLTWEPLFAGHDRLDPVQPRLQNILNGEYNNYIDAFADDVKKLSDTIIIRLMHEFEGDWYPWSICKNGNDPSKYVAAYRLFVDRFRARGATKVKWMWCVNSDYTPYDYYNWIVKAYPGDAYVNIIATDIYNNHFPVNLPWWRSFRWQMTESYYYLSKYIPNKPLYVCEVGCRERQNGESPNSETKGQWYARMDKELQSNYKKARALIFFHANPDQVWMVNSSENAIQSLTENVWNDDYYFRSAGPTPQAAPSQGSEEPEMYVYPNPANDFMAVGFVSDGVRAGYQLRVVNSFGKVIFSQKYDKETASFTQRLDVAEMPKGIYYVELTAFPKEGNNQQEFKQSKKVALL